MSYLQHSQDTDARIAQNHVVSQFVRSYPEHATIPTTGFSRRVPAVTF